MSVEEIPVDQPPAEVAEEEAVELSPEAEVSEAPEAEGPVETAPKRKVGRHRKEPDPKTPRVKAPAKPKPKLRQPREKENEPPQLAPEEPQRPFEGLSSAQLVAELVNRRRTEERAMKANLYRSFVM